MNKKVKSVMVTQNDYIIHNVTDEELDIHGHPGHFTEYGIHGQPLKEIKYDRHGNFEEMHLYTYDEKGFLISDSLFPEEGQEAEKVIFEYNDSGLLTKTRKQYLDGSVDTTVYYYDENQIPVKKVTTSDDDEPDEVEFYEEGTPEGSGAMPEPDDKDVRISRNEKGLAILEEVYSGEGELLTRVERKYNEEDQPVEVEVFIDGQGQTLSRHYILHYDYTYFED